MIKITDKVNCCGCEACAQACPKGCISFHGDEEGFLYPLVNLDECIDCGLCEKSCPIINQKEPRTPLHVYAAKNPDEIVRLKSSSGGVFSMFAEQIIEQNGVVFGAKWNEKWEVVHGYVETKEELHLFRGSKYVQSVIGSSYKDALRFLKEDRKVLFCGTPCQIAGLKQFLRKDYHNLYTVDFICHGVPSPGVWRKYLSEVEKEWKQNIKDVEFRNKARGWKRFSFYVNLDNDNNSITLLSPHDKNPYMQAFLSDLILRPSCHECPAKCGKSHSDITIADFWGVWNLIPSIDDDKGTSLVLINTEKGSKLFDINDLHCKESNLEALRYNPPFYNSAKPNPKRESFYAGYLKGTDLHRLIEKTLQPSFVQKIKKLAKYSLLQIQKAIKTLFRKDCNNQTGGGKNFEKLKFSQNKSNFEISNISFRDKRSGWKYYHIRIELKDGQ